jgi:integrase
VTRGLADSYRAELVRAARRGLEFDLVTGEPALWAVPARPTVTWHAHAVAYVAMKWPALSAHSRASLADALATITPALTRNAPGRAPAAVLRAALYACAFNPACAAAAEPAAEAALAWAERASVPVARLADPAVLRAALDALAVRLDGHRAAANTIARKRAVFHNALGYAVETGLLDANPADQVTWRPPKASGAVTPQVVASPAQAEALLAAAEQSRPELTAFFGCLYYAALRPEEAIALRHADCHLPATGWGKLTLTRTAPRTAAAWTGNGTSHEQRGLKQRPEHAVRAVPIPPALVTLLRRHHDRYGTADDGRLFPGSRGGLLSESTYGRAWQQARTRALGRATAATGLARRPYDLRHAALSLWLNAGAPPAQIAARAGHSVRVLLSTYAHCIDGQDAITNRQIEHALSTQNRRSNRTASGATDRRSRPDHVRHMSASGSHHAPRPARRPLCTPRTQAHARPAERVFPQVRGQLPISRGAGESGPRMAHRTQPTVCVTAPLSVRAADACPRQRL